MKAYDVVVIGGGPAGSITAGTAVSYYPDKSVLLVKDHKQGLVPCGIPYTFHDIDVDGNIVKPKGKPPFDVLVDTAESLDLESRRIKLAGGEELEYQRLVLATGSTPKVPGWLPGRDLEGVFYVEKSVPSLRKVNEMVAGRKRVVIIGGGFIGIEVAEQLRKDGHEVTVVELLPHVLATAFDDEFCVEAEEILAGMGVELVTGARVTEIIQGEPLAIKLEDGRELPCDAVGLSVGYAPNSKLGVDAGMKTGPYGALAVDEYMRTSSPGVFAVGDCCERVHFATRRPVPVMLASTSTAEARLAGANLFELKISKSVTGTIAIFSTAFGGRTFAAAGITEQEAAREGFELVTAEAVSPDHHPGTLPGTVKQKVKLIAMRASGTILGAQASGASSVGELINMLGLAIQHKLTVSDLLTSQIGTHPLLTAPPTTYPVTKAAEQIVKRTVCA